MSLQKYICPLCQGNGEFFHNKNFQKCIRCQGVFRCPEYFMSPDKEKARYGEHNNDVQDIKYQNFVSPIVNQVLTNHTNWELWLDFWAGTGPVISHLLWKKWFEISLYDPFFHNKPELLLKKYDFIIACEVVEHFHNPYKEFQLLHSLLKPQGKLYIMTDLYSPAVNFQEWYYKNDLTHVFFYSEKAFDWIRNDWPWKKYSRDNRCIVLEK